MKNNVKAAWAAGRPTINGWLSIASSFSAEIMANQGYDSLTIDIQHGALDYGGALPMMQALRASGVTPFVRVPWNEPGIIMKSLDAGAHGIICPMVNSRAEAEALVEAMYYPPKGKRSFGPTRVLFAEGADYHAHTSDEILCIAMVETAEAMENLQEIAATPGIDALYIGPSDLTIGYTNGRLPPGFDRQEEEMIEVIKRILDAAHTAGKRAALHCGSPEYAARAVEWGFDMTTVSGDVRLLAAAAGDSVKDWRQRVGG